MHATKKYYPMGNCIFQMYHKLVVCPQPSTAYSAEPEHHSCHFISHEHWVSHKLPQAFRHKMYEYFIHVDINVAQF